MDLSRRSWSSCHIFLFSVMAKVEVRIVAAGQRDISFLSRKIQSIKSKKSISRASLPYSGIHLVAGSPEWGATLGYAARHAPELVGLLVKAGKRKPGRAKRLLVVLVRENVSGWLEGIGIGSLPLRKGPFKSNVFTCSLVYSEPEAPYVCWCKKLFV